MDDIMKKNHDDCLSEETLYKYVNNHLSDLDNSKVKDHLEGCLSCFKLCAELKELIYLQKHSPPVSQGLLTRLKNLPDTLKTTGSRFDVMIEFSKDAINVLSSLGWDRQKAIDLAFVTRDDQADKESDTITLTREFKEHTLGITLIRKEEGSFQLMVSVTKEKKRVKDLKVYLLKEDIELEFIDLNKHTTFNYTLKAGEYFLIIKKKKQSLFEFSLIIKGKDENTH